MTEKQFSIFMLVSGFLSGIGFVTIVRWAVNF